MQLVGTGSRFVASAYNAKSPDAAPGDWNPHGWPARQDRHGCVLRTGLAPQMSAERINRHTHVILFAESNNAPATPVVAPAADATTIASVALDSTDVAAATVPAVVTSKQAPDALPQPQPTAALSAAAAAVEPQQTPEAEVDLPACIQCICLSLSKCDASVCDPTEQLCDLWHISYMTWRASGSPMLPDREFPNPISAFEHCRSNATCAAQTVAQYFQLHKTVSDRAIMVLLVPDGLFESILFVFHRTATQMASSIVWM